MVDVRLAFSRLSTAAPDHCVAEWESSIEAAEIDREDNPAAMDIMHSQIKCGQSLKEIAAEIMKEDGLSISQVADNGEYTEWLLQGLNLEDDQ